ncbi:MAG: pre-peptidase C-terminal domain-containing protein [Colwellia sp.]|nr:pre-peptidase C-terminal domain-containing protein [Colwellia sp.]
MKFTIFNENFTLSILSLFMLTLSANVTANQAPATKLPLTSSQTEVKSQTMFKSLKNTEKPLQHILILHQDAITLSSQLEAMDYDVLQNTITNEQLEVIVSAAELATLKEQDIVIEILARGSPFQDHQQAMAIDAVDVESLELAPPSGYKNLEQVMQELNAIAALNPSIAKVIDITAKYNQSSTIGGRHMYAIKISDNVTQDEDEANLLIVSNHHVRELVTPVIALTAARHLVDQYVSNQQVTQAVDNNEIWIAANWNPDGYVHVFTVDNMWRKNRRPLSNGIGVDLNRNYPVGWSTSCSGSTSHSSQTYKGQSAGSEVETQTMMAWANDRRFTKVIDFHSSGREILWDYHPNCATHPFDIHQKEEGKVISIDAGYDRWRSATALGENFQWHLKQGANAYLMETHSSFQPSYASAQSEAEQLWPAILKYFNRAISVVGHVTDKSGNVLSRVNVAVQGKSYPFSDTNFSDQFGKFNIHLPSGEHILTLSKSGHPSVNQVITVSSGNSQNINIVLDQQVDDIQVLTNKVTVDNLSALKEEQRFFILAVPAGATSLAFTLSGDSGDADLYVRNADKPTLADYDCRPYIGGNNERCVINNISAGDWYVMLNAYSNYANVSLVGEYAFDPVDDDIIKFSNLAANKGSETHYSIDVADGRSTLTVEISAGTGDADLYVNFGSPPTKSNYDCRPYEYGNNEECELPKNGSKAYIMIHAYTSYSGLSLKASSH